MGALTRMEICLQDAACAGVYDEARGLLEADAEPRYVMNSL